MIEFELGLNQERQEVSVGNLRSLQKPSFKNTLAFVTDEKVGSVPIDKKELIPLKSRGMTQGQWIRNWEIAGTFLGTDKSFARIGEEFGIKKTRAFQVVKQNIEQLHQSQNPEVQDEHPLSGFGFNKKGISRPGTSYDYQRRDFTQFEKLRDPELSDKDKQELLDKIDHYSLKFLTPGEDPIAITLSTVSQKAGLHLPKPNTKVIYELLRNNNIPVALHTTKYTDKNGKEVIGSYYFICASDKDRAIKVINEAPELDKFKENPVKVLGRPTDEVPNSGVRGKSEEFAPLGPLLKVGGGRILIKAETLIQEDCPVSVFRIGYNIFYKVDDQEELREYIVKRLIKLIIDNQ